MKESKWLTIITFSNSMVALACVFGFNKYKYPDIAYDLSLSIFSGALLGFIMSLVEYFANKRRCMEAFYNAALDLNHVLGTAKYYFSNVPIEPVSNLISEKSNDDQHVTSDLSTEHERKNQFAVNNIESIKEEAALESELDDICGNGCNEELESNRKKVEEIFDIYIAISNVELRSLDDAYGDLDYIFTNKCLRRFAYNCIYQPLRETKIDINRYACHFKLYKEDKGNIFACIGMLDEINDKLFRKEKCNANDYEDIKIYREFYNNISAELEKFRCKIYRLEYVQEEPGPVFHIRHKL